MNNRPLIVSRLLVFFAVILFSSCGGPIKPALMDNPSDKGIDVYIDKRHYMIPPRQQISIDVRHGKVSLKVNEEPAKTIKLNKRKSYLINPLEEPYYLEDIRYFTSPDIEQKYYEKNGEKRSEIGAFSIQGDYKKIEGKTLIEQKYTLGLDKDRTSNVNVKWGYAKNGSVVVRKLHRESDLLDEILGSLKKALKE